MSESKGKKNRLAELEAKMSLADFWDDKDSAQSAIKEYQELKSEIESGGKYERGNAVLTVFAGAGGDDAEDFASMLLSMYLKYIEKKAWSARFLHKNQNENGGYRNATVEVEGGGAYGDLKNESGVHRLVRVSPFNANKKRHTSFAMVEVIPKFSKTEANIEIPENEIEVTIAKSGGPGGQNVNKRETAVRITHIPTKLSVHVDSERSQGQNKEKAIELLKAKLYKRMEEERKFKEEGMQISKTTSAEWGSQIRSYVLHPYKMVKDHRTGVQTANVDGVLKEGEIDEFIEAERAL